MPNCRVSLPPQFPWQLNLSSDLAVTVLPRLNTREQVEEATTASATKTSHKIDLCVRFSALRLFHVGHVVQNKRRVLSLALQEWFSCESEE